jgi:hypothetical protein
MEHKLFGLLGLLLALPSLTNAQAARRSFDQVYEAGGFFSKIQTTDGTLPLTAVDHVCFLDDPQKDFFFTFNAWTYSKAYAEAYSLLEREDQDNSTSAANPELKKMAMAKYESANETIQTIHASEPYMRFLNEEMLNVWKSGADFFRDGGAILEYTGYEHGVKVNNLQFHNVEGEKDLWFVPTKQPNPSDYTRESETLYLSIEPSTMRFLIWLRTRIEVGHGDTAAKADSSSEKTSGSCEEIPAPAKKNN